mmetsp:Transcript_122648/g.354522  ORF Transcript_122648/g.354522 Transcript_122648/m.354522 type:complete len:279 (+) Transcript_122648:430-1266(+)
MVDRSGSAGSPSTGPRAARSGGDQPYSSTTLPSAGSFGLPCGRRPQPPPSCATAMGPCGSRRCSSFSGSSERTRWSTVPGTARSSAWPFSTPSPAGGSGRSRASSPGGRQRRGGYSAGGTASGVGAAGLTECSAFCLWCRSRPCLLKTRLAQGRARYLPSRMGLSQDVPCLSSSRVAIWRMGRSCHHRAWGATVRSEEGSGKSGTKPSSSIGGHATNFRRPTTSPRRHCAGRRHARSIGVGGRAWRRPRLAHMRAMRLAAASSAIGFTYKGAHVSWVR